MSKERKQSTEAAVREIRRRTRRKFSPEEKVRIVLEGLRGKLTTFPGFVLAHSPGAVCWHMFSKLTSDE